MLMQRQRRWSRHRSNLCNKCCILKLSMWSQTTAKHWGRCRNKSHRCTISHTYTYFSCSVCKDSSLLNLKWETYIVCTFNLTLFQSCFVSWTWFISYLNYYLRPFCLATLLNSSVQVVFPVLLFESANYKETVSILQYCVHLCVVKM